MSIRSKCECVCQSRRHRPHKTQRLIQLSLVTQYEQAVVREKINNSKCNTWMVEIIYQSVPYAQLAYWLERRWSRPEGTGSIPGQASRITYCPFGSVEWKTADSFLVLLEARSLAGRRHKKNCANHVIAHGSTDVLDSSWERRWRPSSCWKWITVHFRGYFQYHPRVTSYSWFLCSHFCKLAQPDTARSCHFIRDRTM